MLCDGLLTAALVGLSVPGGFDLNEATMQELLALEGITDEQASALYGYIYETGGLTSVYDVMNVPGFGPAELEWLKDHCVVVPPGPGTITTQVMGVMERLAEEDGPGDASVDMWEHYLVRPLPINSATSWQIRSLDRVSLVDAAAVERRLRTIGEVSAVTSLRGSDNLSYYGYRNLRDFVSVRELDLTSLDFFGNYRVIVDGGDGRFGVEEDLGGMQDAVESAIFDIESGGRGYSAADSAAWLGRLETEASELRAAENATGWVHRIRVGLGDRFTGGLRLSRGRSATTGFGLFRDLDLGDLNDRFDAAKAFVSVDNLGALRRVVLGNYNLSLNQGLFVDNSDELIYRSTYRNFGLYPDLTSTRQFAFTGGAFELAAGPFLGYGFLSSSSRDAVSGLDGTPDLLVMSPYRTGPYADALMETTAGGYGYWDLGGPLPYGTAVGAGYMSIAWSDSLDPEAADFDVPDDSQPWDCPEFDDLPRGDAMALLGLSAQTVIDNLSLEGEVVRQDNDALAALATARWQNDYFYLMGIWRHYDLAYTNPYSRGFTEQLRFDDTIFEKPYYLNDPLASQVTDWPTPKPEEGLYLETRFQLSRQVTITKAYVDLWRTLAWGFDNYRFQGEVEYRPDFPVRFRFKLKYQDKTKMQDVVPTTSRTTEYTLRTFFLPSGGDFFDVSLRLGMVDLTPNPLYSDDRLMTGGFVSARWEHNFSENLSVLGGTTLWTTDGMSQWEFEDTGIDFLDGDGTKFYITIKNNLSDNLQLRLRVLRKDTFYPRTGLYRPDPEDEFHYQGDPDSQVGDFEDRVTEYGIRCQLDFRW